MRNSLVPESTRVGQQGKQERNDTGGSESRAQIWGKGVSGGFVCNLSLIRRGGRAETTGTRWNRQSHPRASSL